MAELCVYAEIGTDGGCLLFTFDPPGLLARGDTEEEAMAAARGEALRLRRLLKRCGRLDMLALPWDEGAAPRICVTETVRRRGTVANGHTTATFRRDLQPARTEMIAGTIDILEQLRAELLDLGSRIAPEAQRFRSLPRRKTIDEQLRHIASCDRWYLSRLWSDLPRLRRSADAWEKLELNRQLVLDRLRSLTPDDLTLVTRPQGERWTVTKLLRRLVYHERFHIDTLVRDLQLFKTESALKEREL